MTSARPLVILETNLLVDFLLGQEQIMLLLLDCGRRSLIDVRVPDLCIAESRGTVRRRLKSFAAQLNSLRDFTKDAERCDLLLNEIGEIESGRKKALASVQKLVLEIDKRIEELRLTLKVEPANMAAEQRGTYRFLAGRPPADTKRGMQDCQIFETVLEIAKADQTNSRPLRAFFTRDSDFCGDEIRDELRNHSVELVPGDKIQSFFYKNIWRQP